MLMCIKGILQALYLFTQCQTMRNEPSAENAASFAKESQVTRKEPRHNTASGRLQESSRLRQWAFKGVTSG